MFSKTSLIGKVLLLWSGVQTSLVVQMIHLKVRFRFSGVIAKHFLEQIVVLLILALVGVAILYKRKAILRLEALQTLTVVLILSVPAMFFCAYQI